MSYTLDGVILNSLIYLDDDNTITFSVDELTRHPNLELASVALTNFSFKDEISLIDLVYSFNSKLSYIDDGGDERINKYCKHMLAEARNTVFANVVDTKNRDFKYLNLLNLNLKYFVDTDRQKLFFVSTYELIKKVRSLMGYEEYIDIDRQNDEDDYDEELCFHDSFVLAGALRRDGYLTEENIVKELHYKELQI